MGSGPLVVSVAEGVRLERSETSETQRSGGVGPSGILSPQASISSGRRLARPSGAVG